jgi:hypothetical protein
MCKAFSCLVTKNKRVIWEAGIDSHDKLIDKYQIPDKTSEPDLMKFARVEVIPDTIEKYPYLYPDCKWRLEIDERITPDWWSRVYEELAMKALGEWKLIIYGGFNYKEALKPFNPLLVIPIEPNETDIENIKKWASVWASVRASVRASVGDSVGASVMASVWDSVGDSVWASVGASVWDSVGDSVRDSVWASVWAYIGSLFPNIKKWKYIKTQEGFPYQSAVDLWKRGFVPSYDGIIWRLHAGMDAKVVYEWS